MDDLLCTLSCSLYLNLSRNPSNIEDLSDLKLFEMLSGDLTGIFNESCFLYTTSIFSNLLAIESTHHKFMDEKGYEFFFKILNNKEKHQHLFLETLDCIKLLLAKREYLPYFKQIINEDLFNSTTSRIEYDLNNLQVLAILSFDQREHILNQQGIVKNIENKLKTMCRNGWFDPEEKKVAFRNPKKPRKSILGDKDAISATKYSVPDWNSVELREEKKDFILALSIILSNLCRDEKYSYNLLDENTPNNENYVMINNFLPKFLNLLEYDPEHPYISEQISILLANLSNCDNFNYFIISDKCMRAMMQIISLRGNSQPTQISILAVLITLLKLSMNVNTGNRTQNSNQITNSRDQMLSPDIASENIQFPLKFLNDKIYLLRIIQMEKDDIKLEPNSKYGPERIMRVTKSIALLIVSNLIALREHTEIHQAYIDFAIDVLKNIEEYSKEEEIIISNNLLYSSLVLFYNLIESMKSTKYVELLCSVLNNYILNSNHKQIIDILLELITLFTRYQDSCYFVLTNPRLIQFVFDKLTSKDPETLELCTLALSRISAELLNIESKQQTNPEEYEEIIKNFAQGGQSSRSQLVIKYQQIGDVIKKQETDTRDGILIYYLNFLENFTALSKVRESIPNMEKLYKSMLSILKENISHENLLSIINILFNVSLTLKTAIDFDVGSLRKLCDLYRENKEDKKLDDKIKKKIIIFVVAATSKETNHKIIIELGFYTQFKHNLNKRQREQKELEDSKNESQAEQDQIELFGIVNLAMNYNNFKLIHSDMKHIHTLACKSKNIDFKTRVDLFSEISKFFHFLYNDDKSSRRGGDTKNQLQNSSEKEITSNLIKALIYTMRKLIEYLDKSNFLEVKYLLTAFFECSQSLRSPYMVVLITVKDYIKFLLQILKGEIEFEQRVFSYSLKVIASEIIFNLKDEKELFSISEIKDIFKYLIKFASEVLQMGIEANVKIVIHALRLISQLVAVIFCDNTDPKEKVEVDRVISFVKEAIHLNKAIPASVNIDALFTLTNLMNIEKFALDKSLNNTDTVNNAIVIFFIFTSQVELDECIVSFLYTISHYRQYLTFIQDIKISVIFHLLEKHLKNYDGNSSIIKKLFSIIYNLTADNSECKIQFTDAETIILRTITMLGINSSAEDSVIHEIALKSLINICKHSIESLEEMDLQDLFAKINEVFDDLSFLSQQYALRFITILLNQWNDKKIEEYLKEITKLVAKFISKWTNDTSRSKYFHTATHLTIIIEKSLNKQLIQQIAECDKELVISISKFIAVHKEREIRFFIETLLIFINKLSKYPASVQNLIDANIPEVGLNYISQSEKLKIDTMSIEDLIQELSSIQNVMKVIKN